MVFGCVNKADHALMARAFGDGVQTVHISKMHAHFFGGGFFQHFARAGVVFIFQNIEFRDGFGGLPQAGVDGVKAVNQTLVGHGCSFVYVGWDGVLRQECL